MPEHREAVACRATGAAQRRRRRVAARWRVLFFLTVKPRRSSSVHNVLMDAVVGSCARSSASVTSGCAATKAWSRTSWPAKSRARNFVCFRGASDFVSRSRCAKRWTHARLTPNVAATSSASPLACHALNTRSRRSMEYADAIVTSGVRSTTTEYYVQAKTALDARQLLQVAAAVDRDGFAGDEVGLHQEEDGADDGLGTAPSAERRRRLDRFRFVLGDPCGRHDRTRGDGVHEDPVGGELERKRFRQRDDARLRDVIGEESRVARPSARRDPVGEIDDPASALLTHVRHGGA